MQNGGKHGKPTRRPELATLRGQQVAEQRKRDGPRLVGKRQKEDSNVRLDSLGRKVKTNENTDKLPGRVHRQRALPKKKQPDRTRSQNHASRRVG